MTLTQTEPHRTRTRGTRTRRRTRRTRRRAGAPPRRRPAGAGITGKPRRQLRGKRQNQLRANRQIRTPVLFSYGYAVWDECNSLWVCGHAMREVFGGYSRRCRVRFAVSTKPTVFGQRIKATALGDCDLVRLAYKNRWGEWQIHNASYTLTSWLRGHFHLTAKPRTLWVTLEAA